MRWACAVSREGRSHLAAVGCRFREARLRSDIRGANVLFVCGDHKEFLHFPVVAAHSRLIRNVGVCLPFKVVVKGYEGRSMKNLANWMYYGQLNFSAPKIGEYLGLSALLGTDELHERLEHVLAELADYPSMLVYCMNTVRESRCKVSRGTALLVLRVFSNTRLSLSLNDISNLSFESVVSLVAYPHFSFDAKLRIVNIALMWLSNKDSRYVNAVLDAVSFESLSEAALRFLFSRLKRLLMPEGEPRGCRAVCVYSNDGVNVNVSCELLPHFSPNRYANTENSSTCGSLPGGTLRSLCYVKTAEGQSESNSEKPRVVLLTPPPAVDVAPLLSSNVSSSLSNHHSEQKSNPGEPMAVLMSGSSWPSVSAASTVDSTSSTDRPRDSSCVCKEATFSEYSSHSKSDSGRTARNPGAENNDAERGVASRQTMNRYMFSSESLFEIEATPDPFSYESGVKGTNESRAVCEQNAMPTESAPFALQAESAFSDVSNSVDPKEVFSPSEILEMNAHPDIVDANFVIGKKLFSAEELDDLRAIAPLCRCSRNEIENAMPCRCRHFTTIGRLCPETKPKLVSTSTSTMTPSDYFMPASGFQEISAPAQSSTSGAAMSSRDATQRVS